MKHDDGQQLIDRAFFLYRKGDVQQAYDLLTEAAPQYPEREQRLYAWRFNLAARLGKLDLAEEIIEDALDSGYFYRNFVLINPEDMQALQGRPFFEDLAVRNDRMLTEAQVFTRPQLEMINDGIEQDGFTPLLISLHGANMNLRQYRSNWKFLSDSEWLVALPQSSQLGGKDVFVWNNMEIAERELVEHYQALGKRSKLSPEKTVISGFSQGGRVAVRAALKQLIPVNHFILNCPYVPDLAEMEALLDGCQNRNLHGYLILGSEDPSCTPGALQLHQEFEKRGFKCAVEVIQGLHHGFPENFPEVFQHALNYVLNR